MKPPDLPKDRPSLIDQAKALGAPAPLKQVVMGVKLAPKPVPPPQRIGPDDVTPVPPVHARARRATETGLAPPAPGSAPVPPPEPPRSVSPIPWDPSSSSQEARREAARHGDRVVDHSPQSASQAPASTVNLPDGSKINRKTLNKLWLWVGPVVLSVLGTAFGYVRGYAQGLSDAVEKIARIETRQDAHAVRMAKAETRIEGVENGLAKEENSNRSERATALARHNALVSDVEALKKAVPKIEGLAPK